jgi:hypothetical protein
VARHPDGGVSARNEEQRDGLLHARGTLQVINRTTGAVVVEDTI